MKCHSVQDMVLRTLVTVLEYAFVPTKLCSWQVQERALPLVHENASPCLSGAQHTFFHTASCTTIAMPKLL